MDALTSYYDSEAYRYDATRGGEARARSAATAVTRLLQTAAPTGVPGPVMDLGTGTGALLVAMAELGHRVVGLDRSTGMLAVAAGRFQGRVLRADVSMLPVRDRSLGAVTAVWLLHLFGPAEVTRIVGEVARVLAPGGVFVSTVDKSTARRGKSPDPAASDHGRNLAEVAAEHGLVRVGQGRFVGVGEGPWREDHAMPAPPGDDPVYPMVAWQRPLSTGLATCGGEQTMACGPQLPSQTRSGGLLSYRLTPCGAR